MAEGASAGDAATQSGIHRSTIYHWQRTNLLFATRLNESRHEVASHFRDQFHARADKALTTSDRLLDDPSTPAAVQTCLALAMLNAAVAPLELARILAQALDHTIIAPMPSEDEDSRYQAFAHLADDQTFPFDDEETDPIDSAKAASTAINRSHVRQILPKNRPKHQLSTIFDRSDKSFVERNETPSQ